MLYRKLGKTGLNVSEIGFGLEQLDRKPYEQVEGAIHTALDLGINIMDVFMPGDEVRDFVGRALQGRRKDVILQGHIGSVDLNEQYDISRDLETCKRYFDKLLSFLKTDYIDLGMLFFMDSHEAIDEIQENGVLEYAMNLKRQGVIRHIGASSHNPETGIRLVEQGLIEMLMFSINAAFDLSPAETNVLDMLHDEDFSSQTYTSMDPMRMKLYNLCEQKGVGITVMKAFAAGKLLSKEHTPFETPMTVFQCVNYALSKSAVSSVLVGCENAEELIETAEYFNKSDEEKDFSKVISQFKTNMKGNCVYCRHCQPCPVNIDIADVNKYLDIALLDKENIPSSVISHYRELAAHGSDCIGCGNCQEKCPFAVEIIENMKTAAKLFGV